MATSLVRIFPSPRRLLRVFFGGSGNSLALLLLTGGKKSSFYHDDTWTIKYLPKFKWHHLTERVAYEKAVRDQKLRAELAQAKRENSLFLKNVETGRLMKSMAERKQKKALNEQHAHGEEKQGGKKEAPVSQNKPSNEFEEIRRRFKQRKAIETEERDLPSSVVSKLFTTTPAGRYSKTQ